MIIIIDAQGMNIFLKSKCLLQKDLEDIGETKVSKEIELQLRSVDYRLIGLLDVVYRNAADEVFSLRRILEESEIGV